MPQILLFPDPKPLVERLGADFFRELPERPGVYLMRGAADALLYVGKAKNLRRRLGSYRVANPVRMPRRHLRLVRAVERIEIQECPDERVAVEQEAHLLRSLRPRFNRAGTWPGATKFLVWKMEVDLLHLAVVEQPEPDWRSYGPSGSWAKYLRAALVRLLWIVSWPERGAAGMPAGWFRGHCGDVARLPVGADVPAVLEKLFAGDANHFAEWILGQTPENMPAFERAVLEADLEFISASIG